MPHESLKPMSILHPTDFSEGGRHALKMAVQHEAHFSILHVGGNRPHDHHWEDFPSVRKTLQRWGLLPPEAPRFVGHQGFLDANRGSTTERVLRNARCPVLAVPGTTRKST